MNPYGILERLSTSYKEKAELWYWRLRHRSERVLSNEHYRQFYSSHFGLDESCYENKTVLDIGCGPRGSLEWAKQAKSRMGLDPLSSQYRKLGTGRHEMTYLTARSESVPLKGGACDVVSSFNSLDHVVDVVQTIREIKRVTRSGGLFLLIVEVNHKPTVCEPHRLAPGGLIELLKPEFSCRSLNVYKPVAGGVYQSIRMDEKYENPESVADKGYMSACFVRTAVS